MTDEDEVIPVDHLVPSPETENTFDLRRLPPHDLDRVEIRVGGDSPRDLRTVGTQDTHRIPALETPARLDNARG